MINFILFFYLNLPKKTWYQKLRKKIIKNIWVILNIIQFINKIVNL